MKASNPKADVGVIFKCGHKIFMTVYKYMISDPMGVMYRTALKGGSINRDKLCPMCREDKRWKH